MKHRHGSPLVMPAQPAPGECLLKILTQLNEIQGKIVFNYRSDANLAYPRWRDVLEF